MDQIPVIDIFAGPGGLGEGFSALDQGDRFRIAVSVEMEEAAHRTLRLRSFFRQFAARSAPESYYAYVRGDITQPELEASHQDEWTAAAEEARKGELGVEPHAEVRSMIDDLVGPPSRAGRAVLIGGPPCQAYSLVGRSRMRPGHKAEFEADKRHFLYREYLRILADHAPAVFVMENVKGLLSSTNSGELMFNRITSDLEEPGRAVSDSKPRYPDVRYRLIALGGQDQANLFGEQVTDARDFVLRAETLGLPQARHRVIILGIREDLSISSLLIDPLPRCDDPAATVMGAIQGLPRLRSGFSQGDSPERWVAYLRSAAERLADFDKAMRDQFISLSRELCVPGLDRGSRFVNELSSAPTYRPDWFQDGLIRGVLNHETRGHMDSDLDRYLFASVFAATYRRSPKLAEFPPDLLPDHRNVERALKTSLFSDRFRVQIADRPATTITSHISKDGHYFIHPDPTQCRSLTVREAARIQTFPDNYYFEGPRTKQYVQVGNAVPPLLALQVARVVSEALREAPTDGA